VTVADRVSEFQYEPLGSPVMFTMASLSKSKHSLRHSGALLHSHGGNEEGEYGNFGWGKCSGSV
jgi:hypothetical protein